MERFELTKDSCGVTNFQSIDERIPSAFEAVVTGEDRFTLAEAGGDPGECVVDMDAGFVCEASTAEEVVDLGFGLSATLSIESAVSGQLLSETSIDGLTALEISCTDGDCYILEIAGLSFPCPLEVTLDMVHD